MKPLPESPRAPSRISQIGSLTALRGIAAWWVVLYHFSSFLLPFIPIWALHFIEKGNLAVDLFFCLSGFVIFLNYGTPNIFGPRRVFVFYLRRLAKIYPLHLFTIGLYVILVGFLIFMHRIPSSSRFSGESLLWNLFLIQDWVAPRELTWNIPSWSISAEFFAYILFPLIVFVVRRTADNVISGVFVIGVLVGILNLFFSRVGFDLGRQIETLGVIRCVTQFGIGAVLAQIYLTRRSANQHCALVLCAFSALFLVIGFLSWESIFIPLSWATLVLAVALGDEKLSWLKHRWLVFIGDISYATYMIHYFVRDIFKLTLVHAGQTTPLYSVLAALAVVIIASVPLYLWFERPIHQYLLQKIRAV